MATKRIECPTWMPILRTGDLGKVMCYELHRSVFPEKRYTQFRMYFLSLWWQTHTGSLTDDWNAVVRQLGYTEDAGWCNI